MSWIRQIEPLDAEDGLRALYAELERRRGKVSNILKVHSLRPAAMQAHLGLYMDLMWLSRAQRELIAVVVSRTNQCEYCVAHHAEALAGYLKDNASLEALARGELPAALSAADRALADYAVKLTRTPSSAASQDVELLRETGFSDADILLANLIVAYFNFVNRIALGLGVRFDPDEVTGYTT